MVETGCSATGTKPFYARLAKRCDAGVAVGTGAPTTEAVARPAGLLGMAMGDGAGATIASEGDAPGGRASQPSS